MKGKKVYYKTVTLLNNQCNIKIERPKNMHLVLIMHPMKHWHDIGHDTDSLQSKMITLFNLVSKVYKSNT